MADDRSTGSRARVRSRRASRRRRALRGILRGAIWIVVLGVTFTFGLGVGRTVAEDAAPATENVTIEDDRGAVTATLPEVTVTSTETVTVTARAKTTTRATAGADG